MSCAAPTRSQSALHNAMNEQHQHEKGCRATPDRARIGTRQPGFPRRDELGTLSSPNRANLTGK
jgi:hypothetical protein